MKIAVIKQWHIEFVLYFTTKMVMKLNVEGSVGYKADQSCMSKTKLLATDLLVSVLE